MIFAIFRKNRFSKISGKTPKKDVTPKKSGRKKFFLPPGGFCQQQRQCDYIVPHTDYTPAQLRHDTGINTAVVVCATACAEIRTRR